MNAITSAARRNRPRTRMPSSVLSRRTTARSATRERTSSWPPSRWRTSRSSPSQSLTSLATPTRAAPSLPYRRRRGSPSVPATARPCLPRSPSRRCVCVTCLGFFPASLFLSVSPSFLHCVLPSVLLSFHP